MSGALDNICMLEFLSVLGHTKKLSAFYLYYDNEISCGSNIEIRLWKKLFIYHSWYENMSTKFSITFEPRFRFLNSSMIDHKIIHEATYIKEEYIYSTLFLVLTAYNLGD